MERTGKGWRSWALSVSISILGALGAWSWTSVSADVKQLQQERSALSERQARTETKVGDMSDTVQRIERKVDQLLERNPRR